MSDRLTFLFVPLDGVGHFQASFGIASILRDRGHTVVYAATKTWKGKLSSQGFREEFYSLSMESDSKGAGAVLGELVAKIAPTLKLPTIEFLDNFYFPMWQLRLKQIGFCNSQLKEIVETVKPDVIIVDQMFHFPALMNSGIPWISVVSVTPLGISKENVPPAYSGYPTTIKDTILWNAYDEKVAMLLKDLVQDYNKWIIENGGNTVELRFPFCQERSPYANFYMYPKELDYLPLRPNPPNYHQFDAFFKISNEQFLIPDKLKNSLGKLVYFSMGTIGCMEVGLMRRLIGILAKSKNRFIVSKGPLGDQIQLEENMWGENSVPQTKVIPFVDLVITHGGNNTVTEAFYFGKRLLVLPLVFDQVDNAQRIYETGHGLSFHPYNVTEKELLQGIETLLGDVLLERRMISISKRIQAEKPQLKAAELIERITSQTRLEQCAGKK